MTSIAAATSPEQLDAVRHLMRAFVAWHRDRHRENISLIERYFDASAFEAELADLPGQSRVGFRVGAPYYDLPPDMKQWLVFMELELPPTGEL
jgi:hypothetical protein